MLEAVLLVFALAFIAGIVVTVIGVVIGRRRKQWKLAIIGGAVTVVSLVIFTAINESTGGTFGDPPEQARQPAVQQAAPPPTVEPTTQPTPSPEPPPTVEPEPTAIPEPLPTPEPTAAPEPEVAGLGITRGEIQRAYEKRLENRNILFSPETSGGNVVGVTEDEKIFIAIAGPADNVNAVVLRVSFGGFMTDDDIKDAGESLYLLPETVLPDWDSYDDWINDAIGKTGTEEVHLQEVVGGKLVEYLVVPEMEGVIFRVRAQ